jgi:hypothetical protein
MHSFSTPLPILLLVSMLWMGAAVLLPPISGELQTAVIALGVALVVVLLLGFLLGRVMINGGRRDA